MSEKIKIEYEKYTFEDLLKCWNTNDCAIGNNV